MFNNRAKTFNSFTELGPIFEASTLSQTKMPKEMISAIHQKLEHWEDYPRMAHTYKGGGAVPMPFKYHSPSYDIPVPEPIKFTGKKTNTSPFTGRSLSRPSSQYKDFAWYLESLGLDQKRILISNPDLDFYMFLYDKSRSKGATGLQYAILAWDKEKKKPVDFGYSELTTREVDLAKIRKGHDTRGGNTAMKIEEYVRSMTRESGEKDYAPSPSKPLYVYEFDLDPTGEREPRSLRKSRKESQTPVTSMTAIDVFANRYARILPKVKPDTLRSLINNINTSSNVRQPSDEVAILAKNLGVDAGQLNYFLFRSMRAFRKEIFEEGRGRLPEGTSAYSKTTGFELEAENKWIKQQSSNPWGAMYDVDRKKYSPEEEKFTQIGSEEEAPSYREASPEKFKRELPVPGNYSSIQSIIKKHKLDGFLSKFAWFLLTGKIKFPEVSIASILGISTSPSDSPDISAEDDENWLY
jgi:hypothetical protein